MLKEHIVLVKTTLTPCTLSRLANVARYYVGPMALIFG